MWHLLENTTNAPSTDFDSALIALMNKYCSCKSVQQQAQLHKLLRQINSSFKHFQTIIVPTIYHLRSSSTQQSIICGMRKGGNGTKKQISWNIYLLNCFGVIFYLPPQTMTAPSICWLIFLFFFFNFKQFPIPLISFYSI